MSCSSIRLSFAGYTHTPLLPPLQFNKNASLKLFSAWMFSVRQSREWASHSHTRGTPVRQTGNLIESLLSLLRQDRRVRFSYSAANRTRGRTSVGHRFVPHSRIGLPNQERVCSLLKVHARRTHWCVLRWNLAQSRLGPAQEQGQVPSHRRRHPRSFERSRARQVPQVRFSQTFCPRRVRQDARSRRLVKAPPPRSLSSLSVSALHVRVTSSDCGLDRVIASWHYPAITRN